MFVLLSVLVLVGGIFLFGEVYHVARISEVVELHLQSCYPLKKQLECISE